MRGWDEFYVIVGAAGSTLIGIQFIVITLVATIRTQHTSEETLSAFATPTIVHFASALVLAAIMAAPWPSLLVRGVVIAAYGVAAFAYALTVVRRGLRQTTYEATREDWVWYIFVPCTVYAALALAGILLPMTTTAAAFVIAAAALGLLLIGIHNAWDSVTFLVLDASRSTPSE